MGKLYSGAEYPDPSVRDLAERLPAGSRVVDLGCDTGRHSIFLAGQGHRVVGVDINPSAIKTCDDLVRHYGGPGVSHSALVGDITTPLLLGRTFDAVICTYVLQDLSPDDARAALRTVQRLTGDGGLSLVATYIGNPVQERMWGRTLLRDGESALTFENAGWTIESHVRHGGPLISANGRLADSWPRSVVLARKPGETAKQQAPSNEFLDRLRKTDPEAYEDVVDYGFGA